MMQIKKAAGVSPAGKPDAAQLEKINALAKTPLGEDETYVFSVRLCDDQTDRDDERFSQKALEELAPMFIGKTGIADHAWSSERQVARIFDTGIEYENGVMFIKAWAYMLRTEKNETLIQEIEGGIKKEVSVGCAVKKRICSICGAEYGSCEHRKGERYAAERCVAVLCEPTDAYEFSFVAVPAQKDAGVLKKEFSQAGEAEMLTLRKDAALGKLYRKELEREVVKLGMILELGVEAQVLSRMAAKMDAQDLITMRKALETKRAELFAPAPQLSMAAGTEEKTDSAFLI